MQERPRSFHDRFPRMEDGRVGRQELEYGQISRDVSWSVPGEIAAWRRHDLKALFSEQRYGARKVARGTHKKDRAVLKKSPGRGCILIGISGRAVDHNGVLRHTQTMRPPLHFDRFDRAGSEDAGISSGDGQFGRIASKKQVDAAGGPLEGQRGEFDVGGSVPRSRTPPPSTTIAS